MFDFGDGLSKAFGAILSALIGGIFQQKQQETQFQNDLDMMILNEELYQKHFKQNQLYEMDMWNRNNEYNSPYQQMKRLGAAGINPNLAVGGINNIASSTSTLSPQSGTGVNTSKQLDIGSIGQFMTAFQQIKNLKASERRENADAEAQEIENNRNKQLDASGMWLSMRQNELLSSELHNYFTENQIADQLNQLNTFKERFNSEMQQSNANLQLTNSQIMQVYSAIFKTALENQLIEKEVNYADTKFHHLDELHKLQTQAMRQTYDMNEFGFEKKKDIDKVVNDVLDKIPFLKDMKKSEKSTFSQGVFALIKQLFK